MVISHLVLLAAFISTVLKIWPECFETLACNGCDLSAEVLQLSLEHTFTILLLLV